MTKTNLVNIITQFAKDGIVFSNEQDFQFVLGTEIQKLACVKKVHFECLSLNRPFMSLKGLSTKSPVFASLNKQYHDLLVELEDETSIVIELKYKTSEALCTYCTKAGNFMTFPQGAHAMGCYNFLTDVSRLENIGSRHFLNPVKISRCYSILLTNDWNYRCNDFSRGHVWTAYSLAESKQTIGPGPLLFGGGGFTHSVGWKVLNSVNLKKQYSLSYRGGWFDYPLRDSKGRLYNSQNKCNSQCSCPGFSFLVFEI